MVGVLGKEDNIVTSYSKPEVRSLGNATSLIEGSMIKRGNFSDGTSDKAIAPAYDLDE